MGLEMNPIEEFKNERIASISSYPQDKKLQSLSQEWTEMSLGKRYVYNFDWLGRPIIQYPQDIVAIQEIIWSTRPDLIIETGIAHGGSLILSASQLAMLDMCDAIENQSTFDPCQPKRKVIGIDIDIRTHNRQAIENHPLSNRIQMLEGSSISNEIIDAVKELSIGYQKVMVCLDSMHTHSHVLAELEAYAPLVTPGCYCVVFDTIIEDVSPDFYTNRPWSVGNNPKTAIYEYLKTHNEFEIDKSIPEKLLITEVPDGFLKRCDN